jgi:hypothetical protein
MELVAILRALWRRRVLCALGFVVSAAVGVLVAFHVSLSPPGLESRQHVAGSASVRVLVDTADSQLVRAEVLGAETLTTRAKLLANLLADEPVKAQIARDIGVAANRIAVIVPYASPPLVENRLSVSAAAAAAATPEPLVVAVGMEEELPIVSLDITAPDGATARRLARASVAALSAVATAGSGRHPSALVASPIAPPRVEQETRGPAPVIAPLAIVVIFGLWCVALLLVSGAWQRWRRRRLPRAAGGPQAVPSAPSTTRPA